VAANLKGLGGDRAVLLAHESAAAVLRSCKTPVVTYAERPADAMPRLVAALERTWPRGVLPIKADPWEDLAAHVAAEGFVDESRAAAILGCAPGDLGALIRRRAAPGISAIAGLGICNVETMAEIRELLTRGVQERAA
jgi:hypothetical protein